MLVLGCGGGGGPNTSSSTAGTVTGIHVEATFPGSGAPADLLNVPVGANVRLKLVGYSDGNQVPPLFTRVDVPSGNWTTTAPSSVATVGSGGSLNANGASGITTYSVQGLNNGSGYAAPLQVRTVQATVTAFVRTQGGLPVLGAHAYFINAQGSTVGEALSTSDGLIRAYVPTTAVKFTVDVGSATSGDATHLYSLYNQFGYGLHDYNLACTNRPDLPTLTVGVLTALPHDIVCSAIVLNQPPPPPPDCGFG